MADGEWRGSFGGLDLNEIAIRVEDEQIDGQWNFGENRALTLAERTANNAADATIYPNALRAGYNPSADAYPTSPNKWAAIDFVVVTNRETGNRIHARSLSLSNVQDPSEINLKLAAVVGGDIQGGGGGSPNGYGPNDDGTDLTSLGEGVTIGFMGAMGLAPNLAYEDFSARIGFSTAEAIRHEELTVTLQEEVNLPQATITIDGDMDAVTSPYDDEVFAFREEGTVFIGSNKVNYAHRTSGTLFGCSGGTGTFAAGYTVRHKNNRSGGRLNFRTSRALTNDNASRLNIDSDGSFKIGERITFNDDSQAWFAISGGVSRFRKVTGAENLTATVIDDNNLGAGTETTTRSWAVVGNTPYGGKTEVAEVEITDAPDNMGQAHYVKLEWDGGIGVDNWDVLRTTGGARTPIVLGQKHLGKTGSGGGAVVPHGAESVDYGQSAVSADEVQTIQIFYATGGEFKLSMPTFDASPTSAIDFLDAAEDADIVKDALVALAGIGPTDVTVELGGYAVWRVTFQDNLAEQDIPMIIGDTYTLESEIDEDLTDSVQPPPPSFRIREMVKGGATTYDEIDEIRNNTSDVLTDGRFDPADGFSIREIDTPTDALENDQAVIYGKAVSSDTKLVIYDGSDERFVVDSVTKANTQTDNYTLVLTDAIKAVEINSASNKTVTIPPHSDVAFPVGTTLEIYRRGAGTVTIAAGSGVTTRAKALGVSPQHGVARLRQRASDEWVISGDLA